MTVKAAAGEAGLEPEVVRYYTRIGLIQPRRNRHNGYKVYSSEDIARLIFIRKAKSLGYTLKEISAILAHARQSRTPCPTVRSIIQSRLHRNRARLEELMNWQACMESVIQRWDELENGVPSENSVHQLVEAFSGGAGYGR
ncbi:DNA-binding transcriptional MerR regulator [Thiohalophilus thiocyanatoxydans]|uniref:DNA-binding transcriptional MerR regulator n=2 Tax=Thiohalophilus thiocyanatoxydans TaxID=381308 RepID=A0A4R8IX54_9GAMM|nr:DNA-binding transcriptional MerR regulator [Thiohalophilus thiocyanatoxydans]